MKTYFLATSTLVFASVLMGQAPSPAPATPQWQIDAGGKMAFDVASVRQNKSGPPPVGDRVTANFALGSGDAYSSEVSAQSRGTGRAEDGSNDTPENRAARVLIRRASALTNFAVKDMKIVVNFKVTHEDGRIETGAYLNEASSTYGNREELRESGYLEGFFDLGNETAVIGSYEHPPADIARARPILSQMAHVKVGPFYPADIDNFGIMRNTEIGEVAAVCVAFNPDEDFLSGGIGARPTVVGDFCVDRDSGVVLRDNLEDQMDRTWSYMDYRNFEGKLVPHKVVFEEMPAGQGLFPEYRIEGNVEFTKLSISDRRDFDIPPGAAVTPVQPHDPAQDRDEEPSPN